MTEKPKEILMILQPRAIPEAIESLNTLDIEKVWFRGYTEMELEIVLNDFINDTDYDYYWIIADDVVVDNKPLEVLRPKLYEGEVVTGYCKLYQTSNYVNLSLKKLPFLKSPLDIQHIMQQMKYVGLENMIVEESYAKHKSFYERLGVNIHYDFWKYRVQGLHIIPQYLISQEEVDGMGDEYFETFFAGWSFTGMAREIWLKYPFQCSWNGNGTDAQFALRFFEEEIDGKIYTHKDSHFIHLKKEPSDGPFLKRNWLVGEEEPMVHFGDGKLLRDEIESEHIYQKKD
jgi:hypothetical protein